MALNGAPERSQRDGEHAPAHRGARDASSRAAGTVPLQPSAWGIKPYRGLMGALKVRDEVEIVVEAYRKSEQPSD